MKHRVVNAERSKIGEAHVRAVLDLRAKGLSMGKIGREIGISESVVQRIVKSHEADRHTVR